MSERREENGKKINSGLNASKKSRNKTIWLVNWWWKFTSIQLKTALGWKKKENELWRETFRIDLCWWRENFKFRLKKKDKNGIEKISFSLEKREGKIVMFSTACWEFSWLQLNVKAFEKENKVKTFDKLWHSSV